MEQPHEHPDEESQRLLKIGIGLSFLIFFLELAGGFWSRSLALMSDAWHIFIDIWSLILSFIAVRLARWPVNDRQTFGFHRMEVMAAALNGLTVFVIAGSILFAAWKRLQTPVPVHGLRLAAIASVGLMLNVGVAWLFYRPSHRDLNLRGAFWHLIGDAMNTLAVLIAALLMLATKNPRIDPIVSALIAFVVLWGSGRLLRESFNTLLEGVPRGIDVGQVERAIRDIHGVDSVHDLHVWSICSHLNALSGHVLVEPDRMAQQHVVLEEIGRRLKERFGIMHTTVQVESTAWPRVDVRLDSISHG